MTDDTELAWAAGFYDGEGSICVLHKKRVKGGTTGKDYHCTSVQMSLAQVRPEPLRRFHAAVGVGKMAGPYYPKNKAHSPYYKWETTGRPSSHEAIMKLWAYLSAPKREQIIRVWAALLDASGPKSPRLKELPT